MAIPTRIISLNLGSQTIGLAEFRVDLGARHRRHQMIDDDRRGAALRLAAFAGVVDDKRIELGKGPERRLRMGRG